MRRCICWLVAGLLLAGAGQAGSGEDKKGTLAPGKDLPGPFHPYNVNGPHKGRFHCLVSEQGLKPLVLLIARGLEKDAAFGALLQQLDGAVARNPTLHLNVFVVFLSDELPSVVADDDKREDLARNLQTLAETLKLRHVVLCLGDKADLARYNLDPGVALTVVLASKLKIVASHALTGDKIKAQAKVILDEVASKLGARR
jgi:hypothetical protein